MKKSVLIYPFLVLGLSTKMEAQKVNEGVYLTAHDFASGKISYESNQSNQKYRLYLHEALNGSTIKIINGDAITILSKDSIFGYRSDDDTYYRFYNKAEYKIINHSEKILLYSTISTEGSPKNKRTVTNYFFSADASSPIYPLTKSNLKTAFFDEVKFIELLNTYFQSDNELVAYDSTDKIYNLNRTYEMYLKSK